MRIRSFSFGILFIMLALGSVVIGSGNASNATPGRYIVTFAVGENGRSAVVAHGGSIVRDLDSIGGALVSIPDAAVNALSKSVGVVSVEADAVVFAMPSCSPMPSCKKNGGGTTEPPPLPPQTLEWGVDRIDADLAWATSTGAGVDVAVIDTGIDADHSDLLANIMGGVNFVSQNWRKPADSSRWDDDNGHGTHVAGIIAAVDDRYGVVGAAPEARLYAVKVLDRSGSGYVSDIISGLEWAVTHGMDVVNLSLGTTSDVQALHDAVDAARDAGVVIVAAAGNSGDGNVLTNDVEYPGKYSSTIAVAAIDSADLVTTWSSSGAEVDIAAPGKDVRSTWNDGLYNTISGTSMATPHVVGVVALMLSSPIPAAYDHDSNGLWDVAEVRAALLVAADDLGAEGNDDAYGAGLVDAEESVVGFQSNP